MIEGAVIVAMAIVVVPTYLARWALKAPWLVILCAYALWSCALLIFFGNASAVELVGWLVIFLMFTSIFAIPLIALALLLAGRVVRLVRRH